MLNNIITDSALYRSSILGIFALVMAVVFQFIRLEIIFSGYFIILPYSIFFSANRLLNVLLVLALFVLFAFKSGKKIKPDFISKLGFLFVLTFIPSIAFSPTYLVKDHLISWSVYITMVLFYVLVINVFDTMDKLNLLLKIFNIILIIYTIVSFLELIFFPYSGSGSWRIRGPWREFEYFSEYLALMFPLVVYRFSKDNKFYLILFSSTIIVLSILTGTRGGPVALACGLIVWWILDKGKIKKILMFYVLLLFLIPIGVASFNFLQEHTRFGEDKRNIVNRFVDTKFEGVIPDTRTQVWKIHMERIRKEWKIGSGPCHSGYWYFIDVNKSRKQLIPNIRKLDTATISYPHCLYLALIELGGVGCLVAFLAIIVAFFVKLLRLKIKLSRLKKYDDQLRFVNVLIVVLTIFVVDEIKIEFIRHPHYMFFIFGGIFGLMGSTINVYNKLLS